MWCVEHESSADERARLGGSTPLQWPSVGGGARRLGVCATKDARRHCDQPCHGALAVTADTMRSVTTLSPNTRTEIMQSSSAAHVRLTIPAHLGSVVLDAAPKNGLAHMSEHVA